MLTLEPGVFSPAARCQAFRSIAFSKKAEQLQEEHHDVDVEQKGAEHVVVQRDLVRTFARDQLRVIDYVQAIDDDAEGGDEGVPPVDEAHEDAHDHEHEHADENAKEEARARREVRLREEGEQGQRHGHAQRHPAGQ